MQTKDLTPLEQQALAAHEQGTGWNDFWQEHGNEVREAEPFCRERFRRLVQRLAHLVATGDGSGRFGVGDCPWEADDAAWRAAQ
jgi:hypothetical protein